MEDTKYSILVAAIDFGTSSSGYAYLFRHEYKMDPLKIRLNERWSANYSAFSTEKAPTCVLLNPQKEFLAFGYEAEQKYSELALDSNHHDHYFFKEFKMVLHETRVSKTALKKARKFCLFDKSI